MQDPTWNQVMRSLQNECQQLLNDGKSKECLSYFKKYVSKGKDLKAVPSFEDAVRKAGGRLVSVSSVSSVTNWHDLEG